MSPYRSPSPFETSEPGDALLSSSISLGGSAVALPGPSIESKPRSGEKILLKTEHLCPSEPNGRTKCRACYEKAAELLKKLGVDIGGVRAVKAVKVGVRVTAAVEAKTSLPEDDSSSADPEEEFRTLSLSTKKAIFDEALSGLESMEASLYIKAVAAREAEESFDEVMRRLEALGLLHSDEGEGDGGEAAYDQNEDGEFGQRSNFILINVYNDLGGDGQAYLQMHELEDNDIHHQGDIDVCFSGAGF